VTHILTVDGFHPAKLNTYLGRHWAVGARKKKDDAQRLGIEAHLQGVAKATGKRRLSIVIRYAKGRPCDADSILKSLLDACVTCGLLLDDGPKSLELGSITHEHAARKGLVLTLEDLT